MINRSVRTAVSSVMHRLHKLTDPYQRDRFFSAGGIKNAHVSYYPHTQDPNAPEPMQVYRYAPEFDDLKIPVVIFIGENEQYQRRRSIETAVNAMLALKRDVKLFVYPGVGRGFDFRPENLRTLADDMAARDAIRRAEKFMRASLARYAR